MEIDMGLSAIRNLKIGDGGGGGQILDFKTGLMNLKVICGLMGGCVLLIDKEI